MTERLRVLESFSTPSAQTNPYIVQLRDSLEATPGLDVVCWTWKHALLGRYDVFHTHWTEALVERRGRRSTWLRWILFSLFLLRLRVTSTPVVRTLHNLELPQGISRVETRMLREVDRLTRAAVVLNDHTPVPEGVVPVLVEHGHYRDWFARYPRPEAVPGRFAFVGKIRRYKNVEGLLRAFSDVPSEDGDVSLHVAGKPSSEQLTRALEELARDDQRIELSLAFIEDETLVRVVGEAELVVLPYNEMHNSGSVLAALSLGRPVLVPDNDFNHALSREVGEGWVLTYSGPLTADALRDALHEVRTASRAPEPDLGARDWTVVGERHAEAFRAAVAARRPAPGTEERR